ncbi:hypothetical protein [Bradyrhizobium roseum]|uniref:hypothetical protein n=1 Tax=Bradyrhizobium roseum TaxID=3056648 RepID=UPI0026018C53|nr:hypothetical protein [Bradyrhizobium roseus]WKA31624.1 hypothetical protein QUH67_16320 [Bradyrhizobium roseus]
MIRNANQLRLAVRWYVVRCDSLGEIELQAGTAAAAKYQAFKRAREAGYFQHRGGFRDFLGRGWIVRELRR